MQATHCPLCYEQLQVCDVAPCMDGGLIPDELEHARSARHTYCEYRIFGSLMLVLCNICFLEFDQYDPKFLGIATRGRIDFNDIEFVRQVEPIIKPGKYCASCLRRLPFLEFVASARDLHGVQRE
ncbi:hypothetical protein NA78x_004323 [Anatilimnocola sp. NA78]|uniref:hypothetical protein n=1 Tax=Anatilimnocola sp. NA78 TaxID=3415683 RepID=UPI003CE4A748